MLSIPFKKFWADMEKRDFLPIQSHPQSELLNSDASRVWIITYLGKINERPSYCAHLYSWPMHTSTAYSKVLETIYFHEEPENE